ncbi:type IA DNA topoisomerase [Acidaminobacter sp. JC074]|uniref:type IA DNA topoisomerase n=1 Tax=Acidaminobacter sp. JC074 TaxID=2530199 RepID=UPI001F109648|nr:type IA DNA topoisomerase [Acidaminobacter sp. JC074]MCH4887642.1 type IA DNA topoisomerase [Acidaminobacter sp. JC074]
MKTLILAEKPSVARNIGDALKNMTKHEGYIENNNYIVTWAFGHLLSLYDVSDYDPTKKSWQMAYFPFIPRIFEYKVKPSIKDRSKPDFGAKKQLNIIRSLINRSDVNRIISACDFDREGQIIGDIIFKVLKPNQPVERLLLNEWTAEAVIEGLMHTKPNTEMIPLRDAGISRQWADWVIGINMTSVTTLKFAKGSRQILNVGRVIMPTLKIIYDRDMAIRNFKPETYYKLSGLFLKDSSAFEGIYFEDKTDQFDRKSILEELIRDVQVPTVAKVVEVTKKLKKEYPPYLFNMSNLQGHVTSKFRGFTSAKVLKVAQSLYEKKYITYPRTASMHLDESLIGKTKQVVEKLKTDLPYEDQVNFNVSKRVFDSKKVESHSAIIPTHVVPKNLSDDEWLVYNAIKNRLLMQFMPIASYNETKVVLALDNGMKFKASGRIQVEKGWKTVENIKSKDKILPELFKGDKVDVREINITHHETKPPNPHTEKTLLKVMETCGKKYKEESEEHIMQVLSGFSIGTAATRADIISKLKNIGYITYDKKSLVTTELGRNMVEIFPVKALFDLEYTGRLEKQLLDISKGQLSKNVFLRSIFSFTDQGVTMIKDHKDIVLKEKKEKEILGKCPNCGGNIIETSKSFGCDQWKTGCKYVIWKNDKFFKSMKKKPTKTIVKNLLKHDRALVKGFIGKSGRKFDAYVKYTKQTDSEYYHWEMEFK